MLICMSTEKTLIPLDLWCKYFRPPKLCFAKKKQKKHTNFLYLFWLTGRFLLEE